MIVFDIYIYAQPAKGIDELPIAHTRPRSTTLDHAATELHMNSAREKGLQNPGGLKNRNLQILGSE